MRQPSAMLTNIRSMLVRPPAFLPPTFVHLQNERRTPAPPARMLHDVIGPDRRSRPLISKANATPWQHLLERSARSHLTSHTTPHRHPHPFTFKRNTTPRRYPEEQLEMYEVPKVGDYLKEFRGRLPTQQGRDEVWEEVWRQSVFERAGLVVVLTPTVAPPVSPSNQTRRPTSTLRNLRYILASISKFLSSSSTVLLLILFPIYQVRLLARPPLAFVHLPLERRNPAAPSALLSKMQASPTSPTTLTIATRLLSPATLPQHRSLTFSDASNHLKALPPPSVHFHILHHNLWEALKYTRPPHLPNGHHDHPSFVRLELAHDAAVLGSTMLLTMLVLLSERPPKVSRSRRSTTTLLPVRPPRIALRAPGTNARQPSQTAFSAPIATT
ncbi:hypothetical protein M407DRAFT_32744 [Tulasnella calospora MUT 4182]|uniref:Uncharacterized protein n=1 Tax=Tulasnella calospora MUT 4182 TaxID=1051891 RepID=A0A0C3L7S5_9AGAM|nr:hypothetical protein M407DRAFT_32744 [Tulasnella calospora MUT 4182]